MTYGGIRAGDLNRRITIQQRAINHDTFGQQQTIWVDYISCWASISPASGRSMQAAQAQQFEVTHDIVIRYRPGIAAVMRVIYQSRIFDIHSVLDHDMQHRMLKLMCSEGLTPG